MRLYFRRLKMFLSDNWVMVSITAMIVLLVILSFFGLREMEPFYRKMTLAQMPIMLLQGIFHAAIFVFLYMTVLRDGFSKFSKKSIEAKNVNVRFDQVLGIDEAKEEAWEVVQLIRDRKKVKQIGGKILKGLLMVGPPGCGKTLLAKAIATEAKIPFISIAGSEFVEVFVGVGASRVRKLFKRARSFAQAHGACIIFIDELEVIARNRMSYNSGGGQEASSTQNQLLVEMDGLGNKKENIIVIGATNAAEDILDPALLRPGRFDRKVFIDKPGLEGREQLFRFYLDTVKHEPSIDVGRLARKAVYKSPAEIENIVKEAAIIALRENREVITHKDLSASMERIELGLKRKKVLVKEERERIAYHETGHLVALYLLHPTDDVFKASILARTTGSLGVVHHQPRQEVHIHDRETLLANIKVYLAGYVAEKIQYKTTSNGVYSDFQNAMNIAHAMVWTVGMSLNEKTIGGYNRIPDEHLSEGLKNRLNQEVEDILNHCLDNVTELLRAEWEIVERFVKELLQKEELEYDEIESIFKEYGKSNLQIGKNKHVEKTPWDE